MTAQDKTFNQFEHTGFQFLITDLDVGLTLCEIASDAGDDLEKRNRNQQNARHAYNSVLYLAAKLSLTEEETGQLNAKLRKLRTELEKLGEVFLGAA